jgi:hypothetical protein
MRHRIEAPSTPNSGTDVWGTYALLVILLGYPYCHAILVAWTSRNAGSVRTRTISAAVYNMSVQAGGVIGSNIYRQVSHLVYFAYHSSTGANI